MSLVMWFACLMAAEGTLYFLLIPESVSPATTVWMIAAPFDGATLVGDGGVDGLVVGSTAVGSIVGVVRSAS